MKAVAHVYALRSYTIKEHGGQFFVSPTGIEGTHRWSKPYATLQRATTAIARKLQREFVRRHSRANGQHK
jgi:hypothetical protein